MPAPHVLLRPHFFIGICWIVLLCIFSSVQATEWTITPVLRLGYENSDNLELTLQPHKSVSDSIVAPQLNAGVQSDTWSITGGAEIARYNYSGEQGLDRQDQTYRFASQYTGERNLFSIAAARVYDSVVSGQLLDPDIGLVGVQKRRDTTNVNPAWTWSMTELTQARLEYQLSQTSYVDGLSSGLYDYQTRAAAFTLTYLLSSLDQVSVIAAYSSFRVPTIAIGPQIPNQFNGIVISTVEAVESNTPSFKIAASHIFSDTLSGSLTVGARRTTTEQQVQKCDALSSTPFPFFTFVGYDCAILPPSAWGNPSSTQLLHDTGATYNAALKKQFEKVGMNFSINRELTASGAGTQVIGDSISLQLDRPLTEKLRGTLQVNNYAARTVVNISNTSTNIRQYVIQPALQWQWSPECNLNFAYSYIHLKRETENNPVQAHVVSATLIYAWQKLSVSR